MASAPVTAEQSLAIDRLKGLLILMIVIGHNSLITTAFPDFRRILYLFHVQSFFLLSACLAQGLPDRRKLADKLLRYEIPYLGFLVIYALFFTLLVRRGEGLDDLPGGLLQCMLAPTVESLKTVAGVSMLWFLPALITFTLLDIALRTWAGNARLVVAALLHVAVACLPASFTEHVPWFVGTAAFLLFPAECARRVWNRFPAARACGPAAVLALVAGAVLLRSGASFRVAALDLPDLVVQDVFLLAAFVALRGLPLPDGLSRFCAVLGRESFVIYLVHTLAFYGLLEVLRLDASAGWPAGIGVLCATIALSLAAGRLLTALPRLRSALFPTGWADLRSAFSARHDR